MSILGTLQDDITDLPDLSLERYERIFKIYEASKDDKKFYFYNILNKIVFPDNINSTLTGLYTVNSRLPLTTISYNIYGDIFSWWMLYILNKNLVSKLFYVEPGIQLRYILPEQRALVYNQITRDLIFNGRHF